MIGALPSFGRSASVPRRPSQRRRSRGCRRGPRCAAINRVPAPSDTIDLVNSGRFKPGIKARFVPLRSSPPGRSSRNSATLNAAADRARVRLAASCTRPTCEPTKSGFGWREAFDSRQTADSRIRRALWLRTGPQGPVTEVVDDGRGDDNAQSRACARSPWVRLGRPAERIPPCRGQYEISWFINAQ